jgi:hypothetical protein
MIAGMGWLSVACSMQGRENRRGDERTWEVSVGGNKPSSSDQISAVPPGTEQVPEGGATSGGGYVYGYKSNPWFLGNTKSVNYCIDMDESNFGPSREQANASITRAIGLWKTAFSAPGIFPILEVEPADALKIGQQEFNLVACDAESVDIRFQFGKLTETQRATLVKPTKYVASAVQTEYDEEQLRGKGFIYVGAEKGSLRPDADDLAEDFLSHHDNVVLDVILVHELGHVFGVPHKLGTEFPMGESVCEMLVTTKFRTLLDFFSALDPKESPYLGYSSYRELVQIQMRDLFAVNGPARLGMDESGLRVNLGINLDLSKESSAIFTGTLGSVSLVSWYEDTSTNPPTHTKVRDLVKFKNTSTGVHFRDALYMRLPKSQKVLKLKNPDDFGSGLPGTTNGSFIELPLLQTVESSMAGEMTVIDTGKVIPVSLKTVPLWLGGGLMETLKGQAVVDGKIVEIW